MTDQPDIAARKVLLRHRMSQSRAELAARRGGQTGQDVARFASRLDDLLPRSLDGSPPVMAGYWPLGDEIDPRPLMTALAGRGWSLALPVVVGRACPLIFRAFTPGDSLDAGPHGTHHPGPANPQLRPHLVLVPLLAFDRRGFRLGYGGGYYDRTLDILRGGAHVKAVGLGFTAQEVDDLPTDAHDQRLDAILTEDGLLQIN